MTGTYNSTITRIFDGRMDLDDDTLRVALLNDSVSYSPDADDEEFVSDVLDDGTTASEFGGEGYSRKDLPSATITQDNGNDRAVLDADDVEWDKLDDETVQGILIYKQVGGDDDSPEDDPLVAYYDGGDYPVPTNGSAFTVEWPANGIFILNN